MSGQYKTQRWIVCIILLLMALAIGSVPVCGLRGSGLMLNQESASHFVRDVLLWSFSWALLGLAYRVFESVNSDYSPWVAYLASYPVRLVVISIFITAIAAAITFSLKLPGLILFGLAGPVCFLFGHEPNLDRVLEFLKSKSPGH